MTTYLAMNGIMRAIELPDSSYGEWIVYSNEKLTYHINYFRKGSKSDMIIRCLLSSRDLGFSIESIISSINKRKNINLKLSVTPKLKIRIKYKLIDLDLKPLPDEWLETFNYSMVPPWVLYPKIDTHDMFWRMGKGEEYLMRFNEYFNFLSSGERKNYKLTYPPPEEWSEFYETN